MPRNTRTDFQLPTLQRLLGGMPVAQFLRDHWQKKPLLVRNAVPGLERVLDRTGLFDLACRDDAESRLVRPVRGNWRITHGPFEAAELAALPKRNWSVLVSGVNMLVEPGDALLNRFNFIPYARLDDLMVSFAPTGGGVGPHFDSYDVFLIQGLGRRRWEISGQDDLELIDDCPLRILKRFRVDQSWELEPGDLLYLPPKYAHNGVALSDCMTWSIGFRAPTTQEIATQFLVYLEDRQNLDGLYADPDLRPSPHPGRIPPAMQTRLRTMIERIRWDRADMNDFLGRYLSEPKPSVFFDPPARAIGFKRFSTLVNSRPIRLDARTRMLYDKEAIYLNGERVATDMAERPSLVRLANRREILLESPSHALLQLLYGWYCDGFLVLVDGRMLPGSNTQ
jgi:50S ribosomal protein L16 3-hydroxylase